MTEKTPTTKEKYNSAESIIEYYSLTTADYEGWRKSYNMHFGYFSFTSWKQLFGQAWCLEYQLDNANTELFKRLGLNDGGRYLDMGCGAGATVRNFAKNYRNAELTGITIVEGQVEYAKMLLSKEVPDATNVDFFCMDYQHTTSADESFDGMYAMESVCHADGLGKPKLLSEVYRLLKPGGKFVVHDAFTLQSPCEFNPLYRYAYYWLCKGWAVEDYIDKDAFEKELHEEGFKNIQFKNAFWNVLTKMLFSKQFYKDSDSTLKCNVFRNAIGM